MMKNPISKISYMINDLKNYFNNENCKLMVLSEEQCLLKDIMLFRGIAEYINQITGKNLIDIIDYFLNNRELLKKLKQYFLLKFNPDLHHENFQQELEDFNISLDF